MTLLELRPLIIEWARDKELINLSIAPKQRLKLLEELGELARAVLLNNINLQKDAIGDIAVVLIILNEQTNSSLEFDFSKVTKSKETDLYEMLKDRYSGSDLNTIIDCINKVNEFNFLKEYIA